ncbi:MAG TPA: hypothetical protein VGE39_11945 [Prosthecobacter sp.]
MQPPPSATRRRFLELSALASCSRLLGQVPGERPQQDAAVKVLNPRGRVPVSIIIDDSTCLVNLNKFAIPQFAAANPGRYDHYPWKSWPDEIPDSFVRKFADWADANGVKGKYSIVPYPACVGRLDLQIPGWTQRELQDSIQLVRERMLPNWDIHPEMVTHTRIIDPKTGHPFPEISPRFMENWKWCGGRSVDEIAGYMSYALTILKNIGLPCEGITTPGGFGSDARPQLAQATFESCRSVFQTEIPHYFRDLHSEGEQSVAPIVQNASGLDSDDPRCVVHVLGCTGDWTGGWDCVTPKGADAFITEDGQRGRLVEVIRRGEPAVIVCHWTGIYWNGLEIGFEIFREVVKRLHATFDDLHWMKLSEIARYWAAKELTRIEFDAGKRAGTLRAPYACDGFTLSWPVDSGAPHVRHGETQTALVEVDSRLKLTPGTWCREKDRTLLCLKLEKGLSTVAFQA